MSCVSLLYGIEEVSCSNPDFVHNDTDALEESVLRTISERRKVAMIPIRPK
jgi:hypothetical protein